MTTLSVSDAQELVRRNLDELEPNGSVMYADDDEDNTSMDNIIKRFLPEAINAIHLAAPAALLEGKDGRSDVTETVNNNVISFTLAANKYYLRLVAFQAADSNIVVTEPIAESSPEGRKQQNQHIRGRKDRPRLVICQDLNGGVKFKYYTTEASSDVIKQFSYVEEQFYSDNKVSYDISAKLRQNIIDYLTARVMETFNDQRSQIYIQRANSYPTI